MDKKYITLEETYFPSGELNTESIKSSLSLERIFTKSEMLKMIELAFNIFNNEPNLKTTVSVKHMSRMF